MGAGMGAGGWGVGGMGAGMGAGGWGWVVGQTADLHSGPSTCGSVGPVMSHQQVVSVRQ